jgi:hypothetical protein
VFHITLARGAAAALIIVALPFFASPEQLVQHFSGRTNKATIRRDSLMAAGLSLLCAIVAIVTGVIQRKAAFFGLGIFSLGFAAHFISRPNLVIVYAFCFVCTLLATMGLAIDDMRGFLNTDPNLDLHQKRYLQRKSDYERRTWITFLSTRSE